MGLKFVVAFILLLSSSLIGYIMALRYSFRVKQLSYFIGALITLETEILYYSTPLPIAMKKLANKTHGSIAWVFEETWLILKTREGHGIDEIWEKAINENMDRLSLLKEDIEIIIDFAKELGFGNKDTQKKHFKYTRELLMEQKRRANNEREKNGRMFNRLGVLLGLGIVIILI